MKSTRIVLLLALTFVLLIASIAAMPAAVAPPNQPTVVATANGGELRVTWVAAAGAQFYTIGWVNLEEYHRMRNAGRDWLDAFHYTTIPSAYTSHTISSLQPGAGYLVLIGARTTRSGGDAPVWSPWANLVMTSGQHGEGFCPITGLAIPEGGYLAPIHRKDKCGGGLNG